MKRWLYFGSYLATIPAANWLIENVGTRCLPSGPCTIPVGFGWEAPSGVLMIGAALFLRDAVQEALGARWAGAAVLGGSVLAFAAAPPSLAGASALAFLISEAADAAVYTPMRARGWPAWAIVMSGLVGALVDSALFLWLAFGTLDFLPGLVWAKVSVSAAAGILVGLIHARRLRRWRAEIDEAMWNPEAMPWDDRHV